MCCMTLRLISASPTRPFGCARPVGMSLVPTFVFSIPPPRTVEFPVYFYFYTQSAWWVAFPLIGHVDTWAVDLVGDVVPDESSAMSASALSIEGAQICAPCLLGGACANFAQDLPELSLPRHDGGLAICSHYLNVRLIHDCSFSTGSSPLACKASRAVADQWLFGKMRSSTAAAVCASEKRPSAMYVSVRRANASSTCREV